MTMGVLTGCLVVDLSILVQGPQTGAMLRDLGADVVKVELPLEDQRIGTKRPGAE